MKRKKGFMTLYVVVIMGAISAGMLLMFSVNSYLSIKKAASFRDSMRNKILLNSCAEVALESIREINSYTGTSYVVIDGNTCSYSINNMGGNNRSIIITGNIKDITEKIQINVDSINPIHIASWQEVE